MWLICELHAQRKCKQYRACQDCTTCADERWINFEPALGVLRRPRPSLLRGPTAALCLNSSLLRSRQSWNGDVLALLERLIYQTIDRHEQTSPLTSLEARRAALSWAWVLAGVSALYAVRSLSPEATLLYAYGPTVLTNQEPSRSEAVRTFSPPTQRRRAFIGTGRRIHDTFTIATGNWHVSMPSRLGHGLHKKIISLKNIFIVYM
jgi:hypothetical protein